MNAAVDVGSNTVRLLVGECREGQVVPRRYFRRITRLGGGGTSEEGLCADAMARTMAALKECGKILQEEKIARVRAVGTAALRSADNAAPFVQQVRSSLHIPLEIIDGEEEARLSAGGVLSALMPSPERSLIFDIGGGSTEFILWSQGRTMFHRSYPLGVVRLSETCSSDRERHPLIDETLRRLQDDLDDAGLGTALREPACLLVGTAGTVTTLAALHLEMTEYDWRRVNNLVLPRRSLQELRRRLGGLSVAEREALPGMEAGRGDLIVPGLDIVLGILKLTERSRLTVSDFGLLEGVLLSLESCPTSG